MTFPGATAGLGPFRIERIAMNASRRRDSHILGLAICQPDFDAECVCLWLPVSTEIGDWNWIHRNLYMDQDVVCLSFPKAHAGARHFNSAKIHDHAKECFACGQ